MKTKFTSFCLLFLCIWQLGAQTKMDMPSQSEFLNYLYSRQHQIEAKLYNLALEGKIKAYKADSLVTSYSIDGLKERVAGFSRNSFTTQDITGIMFLKKVDRQAAFETHSELAGMALMFEPMFSQFVMVKQPLFWVNAADLKQALNKDEPAFLSQLYYYAQNSNHVFSFWTQATLTNDAFYDLNNSGCIYIRPDSILYQQIVSMLCTSHFYVYGLLHPEKTVFYDAVTKTSRLLPEDKPIIFDEQKKKYLRFYEFQDLYKHPETVFILTSAENPTMGKDTTFDVLPDLEKVNSVSFDKTSKELTAYHLKLADGSSFRIDAVASKDMVAVKPITWYFEDYIRWKKL